MGERSRRGVDSERYWRIRMIIEFIKLGIWIGWQCLRRDPKDLL